MAAMELRAVFVREDSGVGVTEISSLLHPEKMKGRTLAMAAARSKCDDVAGGSDGGSARMARSRHDRRCCASPVVVVMMVDDDDANGGDVGKCCH